MGILDNLKTIDTKATITPDSNMSGVIPASVPKGSFIKNVNSVMSTPEAQSFEANKVMATPTYKGEAKELQSFFDYGVNVTKDKSITDLQKERATNQKWYEQGFNSLVQMVGVTAGDAISGIGAVLDFATFGLMDDESYSNFLTKIGDSISEGTRELAPIYRKNPNEAFDIQDDFSGWFFSQLPSVASSLGLMPGGMLVTKGVNMLGKGAKAAITAKRLAKIKESVGLTTVGANRLGVIADSFTGAVGMRVGENYQESRQVANQLAEEGIAMFDKMTDEEFLDWKNNNPDSVDDINYSREELANSIAKKGADRAFSYNSMNIVFDFIQLHTLNKAMRGLANRGATSTLRAEQNAALNRISNVSLTGGVSESSRITQALSKANIFKNSTAGLIAAEWTEGIEEAINFIGSEEGTSYGKFLQGDALAHDGSFYSSSRMQGYLKNPHLYNSALWGVIGGVMFGGTMNYLNNKNLKPGKGFFTDNENAIFEKQRGAEIQARDALFASVRDKVDMINNGVNPFTQQRNESNELLYLEDDSITLTTTPTNIPAFESISDENERKFLFDELQASTVSEIGLNAIRYGNFELLKEYVNDERAKQMLIDSGIATEETYNEDLKAINNKLDDTVNAYYRHSNNLINAGIEDSLLDIAIANNIKFEAEAAALNKRIESTDAFLNELITGNPTLQEHQANGNLDLTRLYALYSAMEEVSDSIDRIDRIPDPSNGDKFAKDTLRKRLDIINNLIAEQELISPYPRTNINGVDDQDSYKLYRVANSVFNDNSNYFERLIAKIQDEIIARDITNSVISSEQQAKEFERQEQLALEQMRDALVKQSEDTLVEAFDNVNDELGLEELNKLLNDSEVEANSENEKILSAAKLLKLNNPQYSDVFSREYNRAKQRIEASKPAPVKPTEVSEPTIATSETTSPTVPTTPITPISTTVTNDNLASNGIVITDEDADTEFTQELEALLEGNNATPVGITKETLANYTFEIKKSFTATGENGAPKTITDFEIGFNRRGVPFISDQDGEDIKIDEFIKAVEAGNINYTSAISNSTIDEGTGLLNVIKQQQQRLERIGNLINLYNKAIGAKTINGATLFNLEDFMRYVQSKNTKGLDNLDEFRNTILDLAKIGNIIITDDNDIRNQSKEDIVSAISKHKKDSLAETIKQNSYTSRFAINLSNLSFEKELDNKTAKVYQAIMSIKSGDYINAKINGDKLILTSNRQTIGEIELPHMIGNTVTTSLKGWDYGITSERNGYTVDFIEEIKNIITKDKEFLDLLHKYKSASNSLRYNPDKTLLDQLAIEISNSDSYNSLIPYFTVAEGTIDRISHLANIVIFDKYIDYSDDVYFSLVIDSLNNWANKVGYTYKGIADIYKKASSNKNKSTKVHIDSTTTGRLKRTPIVDGKRTFNKITDVIRNDQSNNRNIKLDSKGQLYIELFDSEGRAEIAWLRNNSANNSRTSSNEFIDTFNKHLTVVFKSLVEATINKDSETKNKAAAKLAEYIGAGKMLYGYKVFNTNGSVAFRAEAKYNLPDIFFNDGYIIVQKAGIKIASFGKDYENSVRNAVNLFTNELSNLSRNVIKEDYNYDGSQINKKSTVTNFNGTSYEVTLPSLTGESKVSFNSFNDYLLETDAVVTEVEAIRDTKGNILGNFEFNSTENNIGFNKKIYINVRKPSSKTNSLTDVTDNSDENTVTDSTESSPTVTPPVRETTKKLAETEVVNPDKITTEDKATLVGTIMSNTTIKGLIDTLGVSEYSEIAELFNTPINVEVEVNEDRYASYNPNTNVITINDNLFSQGKVRFATTVIHEALHGHFAQMRANNLEVRKEFEDVYDNFTQRLDSDFTAGKIDSVVYNSLNRFSNKHLSKDIAIEEFVVEALTNRQLAKYLSTIKTSTEVADSNTLFGKLLDAIKKLININTDVEMSVLDEIANRLNKLVSESKTETTVEKVTETVATPSVSRDASRDRRRRAILDSNIDEIFTSQISDISVLYRATNAQETLNLLSAVSNAELTTVCK